MGLNLKGIGRKIEDVLGGAVDAVVPGDQSYLHNGSSPGQIVHQAGQQIRGAVRPSTNIVSPLTSGASQIGHIVSPLLPSRNFIQGVSQGAGQAGEDAIFGTANLLTQNRFAPQINQLKEFGSRNYQAPKPGEQSTGYVVGQAAAEIPKLYAGGVGAKLGGTAAELVPKASPVIKALGESIGATTPYDVLSNRTKPADVATDIAVNTGADLGLRGAVKGAQVVANAVRPKISIKTDAPVQPAQTTLPQTPSRIVQPPSVQPVPVTPKALEVASSPKPSMKVAQKQPPDELAKALGLDHTPTPNAEPVTMASVEKGINNVKMSSPDLPPRQQKATQYAINRELSATNNPTKVDIPAVKPGDYAKARSNTQLASNPIKVLTNRAARAVDKLHPQDKAQFWRYVEQPELVAQAKHPKRVAVAVARWRDLANTSHATDRALGGTTGYLDNYARGHNFDLSNPQEAQRYALAGGRDVAPEDFKGLNNMPRSFKTIAEAEAAGFKQLPTNPAKDVLEYGNKTAGALRRQALVKGLTEADAHNPVKSRSLDLKNGQVVPLSEQGIKEAKTFEPANPSKKLVVKGTRKTNQFLKSTLLSAGQFHPINISLLRAAPTLALKGHPVAAAKGAYRTFRAAFGSKYADRVIGQAIKDGSVEKAARIGMPYGESEFQFGGIGHGVGEYTVFGKQMPMMHDQVARSIIRDLEKKKISLDSPQARQAGLVGNELMGFLNKDIQNISPKMRQAMTDWMLAGQFTPSKVLIMKDAASKGGVAGSYARRAAVANVAATALVAGGIGYLLKQESDNARDILLRAMVDPAVPTPLQDDKGNTIKLRLPGSNASDIAHLLGIKLVRQDDGHLGVSWKPSNMPSTVEDFLRARLSPLASAGVKVATNSTFAGKPLYDPNASFGTKVAQAGTTLVTGSLPIGLQGVAYTDYVKNLLPESVQQVLDANTPGSNPILKSMGSSFGLTPTTDQTVGKGLETSQYFTSRDDFRKSLDKNEQALFDKLNPAKKDLSGNPISSKTALTSAANYDDLLANPGFLNKYQSYQQSAKSHDPLWDLAPDQLKAYMAATVISKNDPGGDPTTVRKLYAMVPQDFFDKRSAYFDSLKAQGANIPDQQSQRPQMSPELQKFSDYYNGLPKGTGQRKAALNSPIGQQWLSYLDSNKAYNNQQRSDLGLPALPDTSSQYSSSSGKSYTRRSRTVRAKTSNSYKYAVSVNAGKRKVGKGKVTKTALKKPSTKGSKASYAKPKVSIKKSMV